MDANPPVLRALTPCRTFAWPCLFATAACCCPGADSHHRCSALCREGAPRRRALTPPLLEQPPSPPCACAARACRRRRAPPPELRPLLYFGSRRPQLASSVAPQPCFAPKPPSARSCASSPPRVTSASNLLVASPFAGVPSNARPPLHPPLLITTKPQRCHGRASTSSRRRRRASLDPLPAAAVAVLQ